LAHILDITQQPRDDPSVSVLEFPERALAARQKALFFTGSPARGAD
jgi:hypothetical protein